MHYRKRKPGIPLIFLGLFLWISATSAFAQSLTGQKVKVLEPFVELRTGPGEGYPVFHTTEAGELLELMYRKTSWVRVRDGRGREGWASVDAIRKTMDSEGLGVAFKEPRFEDFNSRRWELGALGGDFDGASVGSFYGGYWWTEYLSTELGFSQILGNFSEIRMINADLVHQPFPTWRVSPFFALGAGTAYIRPKSSLVDVENRNEDSVHFGLGVRFYVSDRYFVRAEYKEYVVFTDRDQNEEAQEWKIGLSVFF